MNENVKINNLPLSTGLTGKDGVSVAELFWGGTNCEPFKGNNGIDYVIASDCIYLEAAFIPLINTLLDLSNEQTTIIISYQKRRKADKRFWNVAKKKFQIQQVSKKLYTTNKSEPIQIFHLKKLHSTKK